MDLEKYFRKLLEFCTTIQGGNDSTLFEMYNKLIALLLFEKNVKQKCLLS